MSEEPIQESKYLLHRCSRSLRRNRRHQSHRRRLRLTEDAREKKGSETTISETMLS